MNERAVEDDESQNAGITATRLKYVGSLSLGYKFTG